MIEEHGSRGQLRRYGDLGRVHAFLWSLLGSACLWVYRLWPKYPNAGQDVKTWAIFANVEYSLSDSVILQAGVRYTDQERDFNGCTYDGGDGTWALTSASDPTVLGSTNPLQVSQESARQLGRDLTLIPVRTGHELSLKKTILLGGWL